MNILQNRTITIFLFPFLFSNGWSQSTDSLNFFPLQVGNKWQYYVDYYGGPTISPYFQIFEIVGDTILSDGNQYYVFNDELIYTRFFRYDSITNKIIGYLEWDSGSCETPAVTLFDLEPDSNVIESCLVEEITYSTSTDSVGLLNEIAELKSYNWQYGGVDHAALAGNIGISEYSHDELGVMRKRLVAANINGVTYGQFIYDFLYSITLDNSKYILGDTITLDLKMVNISNDTIAFSASSWFELLFVDSGGTVVEGLFGLGDIFPFTIPPGDSLTLLGPYLLSSNAWSSHSFGNYHILMKPTYNYTLNEWDTASFLFTEPMFELPNDSASFGIFICDYTTGELEQGTVLNVSACDNCDSSGVPLFFTSQPAADFGWHAFHYSETGDTVFYGTMIWMGTGEIVYPEIFFPADTFIVRTSNAQDPDTFEYWAPNVIPMENDSLPWSADTAYQQIRKLLLVHDFAEVSYQILLYLYPPAVGVTDWSEAKWVFFLFRNPEDLGIQNEENILSENFRITDIYPNPFNPSAAIRFNIGVESLHATTLRIYDITGRLVETLADGHLKPGTHEIVWNANRHSTGMYFVEMRSGTFRETQKMLLLK